MKYRKLWSVLLEHIVECRYVIHEEWYIIYVPHSSFDKIFQGNVSRFAIFFGFRWSIYTIIYKERIEY